MSDTQNVLTEQAIFDAVCEHMDKQREPAMYDGECAYRTEDGKACAVGCLLTDEEVSRIDAAKFNRDSVKTLATRGLLPDRLAAHLELLRELQSCHDAPSEAESGYMARWKRLMAREAASRNLSTARLDVIEVWP